jgi:branched-chain amino acid transport system permease protein
VSAGIVIQAVVSGLAAGAVYGLVAAGFALTYRLTRVLQFAHGDFVGAASFAAIAVAFGSSPAVAVGAPAWRYALAVAVVLAVSGLLGLFVYRVAVRPFARNAIGWIGATAAVAFAIQGTLGALFPGEAYALPDPLPFSRWKPISLTGGASLSPRVLWVLGVGIAVALVARAITRRGWFGTALSAIASEPDGARLVGLPVERYLAIAFALAGALAGVAGLVGAPDAGAVGVQTGALFGLKAIAAAIIGGLVNVDRVYVAALGVGVVESCIATLPANGAGAGWRNVAPLLVAVLLLALRAPRAAYEDVD